MKHPNIARKCMAARKRRHDDSDSSEDEKESKAQRRMMKAAKALVKGAKMYDLAMAAAKVLKKD